MEFVSHKKQKGIALILVLTMLSIVIGLSSNYILTISRDTESIDLLNSRVQAKYSAFSGIQYAIYAMGDSDKEIRWQRDGKLYSVDLAGGVIYVRIMPESGKVDINNSDDEMIKMLFMSAGIEEENATKLKDNLLHWRNIATAPYQQSVSDEDYEALGLSPPPHRELIAIEEVAKVYGVTPAIYQRIKSMITVRGSAQINGLVTSDAVLNMLQLSESDIARIHEARDAYFNNEVPIPNDIKTINKYLDFTTRSAYYRVIAHAVTAQEQTETVYAVFSKRRNKKGEYIEMERGLADKNDTNEILQAISAEKAKEDKIKE